MAYQRSGVTARKLISGHRRRHQSSYHGGEKLKAAAGVAAFS